MQAPVANSRVSFGLYEVDLHAGELWKAGFRVKLQSQPFKVLTALLERPGQVVTREELQLRLWGRDTVVDFDHSLGTAINKIREALGDSAENPRFIETLSRRGYRFIAPVSRPPDMAEAPEREIYPQAAAVAVADGLKAAAAETVAPPSPSSPSAESPAVTPILLQPKAVGTLQVHRWAVVISLAALTAAGYLLGSSRGSNEPRRIARLTHNGHLAPSINNMENLAPSATDGVHLFSPVIDNGRATLAAISLQSGSVTPLSIPAEVAAPALGDISPDGSRLLLRDHLSPESEQPLWVVPTIGGSAQRVGNTLAHDATWMPDGNGILYANGNNLYLTHLTGNSPQLYASLPGRAFWLRWQPGGKLLRFTLIDPISHTPAMWQLSDGERKPEAILSGFANPSSECCGVWTADGNSFVFQSARGGNPDLWELKGTSTSHPARLTNGPLQFQSPVAARSGNRIYFLGVDARSELQRLVPGGALVPEKGFLNAAVRADYSRDGKWVAWTDRTGQLWRARNDGTEQLQLSPENMDVFLAHWSPDGSHLALMAREPGKAWQIYVIAANGDDIQLVLQESRNAADPSWSADGQSLAFGRVNDMMGKENAERTLHVLDLRTKSVTSVPGSQGLFSPRWSPDGRYIAALTLDQRQVRLFTVASQTWSTLSVPSGADPVWSGDSRFLYLHASLDAAQPIDRISIPDGHVEELIRLADSPSNDVVDYVFVGVTPTGMPLVRSRVFTGNVYTLDLR